MAKDAKGHGSEKRGAIGAYTPKQGEWAGSGAGSARLFFKQGAASSSDIARAQRGARQIAEAHGLPTEHLGPGGPIKVQTLDTRRAGQPWATKKAYGNRTVAETVAKGMRTDGGFMRIKTR